MFCILHKVILHIKSCIKKQNCIISFKKQYIYIIYSIYIIMFFQSCSPIISHPDVASAAPRSSPSAAPGACASRPRHPLAPQPRSAKGSDLDAFGAAPGSGKVMETRENHGRKHQKLRKLNELGHFLWSSHDTWWLSWTCKIHIVWRVSWEIHHVSWESCLFLRAKTAKLPHK
jgi:hypothetical protein